MVTSLDGSKDYFHIDRLQTYRSTNPETPTKIGSVNLEIIGPTGIFKNK